MHRRIRTAGLYRPVFLTVSALAVLGGCNSGTVTLRPQGGIASYMPASPTPTPKSSATATATPMPSATATSTPTAMPTATPTATPSSVFTFTGQFGTITTLSFPQSPSACPSSSLTQSFSVQETGYSGAFTASSSNTASVTVVSTGNNTFNATEVVQSTNVRSSMARRMTAMEGVQVTVTDTAGNYAILPVNFNLVCL